MFEREKKKHWILKDDPLYEVPHQTSSPHFFPSHSVASDDSFSNLLHSNTSNKPFSEIHMSQRQQNYLVQGKLEKFYGLFGFSKSLEVEYRRSIRSKYSHQIIVSIVSEAILPILHTSVLVSFSKGDEWKVILGWEGCAFLASVPCLGWAYYRQITETQIGFCNSTGKEKKSEVANKRSAVDIHTIGCMMILAQVVVLLVISALLHKDESEVCTNYVNADVGALFLGTLFVLFGSFALSFGWKVPMKFVVVTVVLCWALVLLTWGFHRSFSHYASLWPMSLAPVLNVLVLLLGVFTEYNDRQWFVSNQNRTQSTKKLADRLFDAQKQLKLAAAEANSAGVKQLIEQAKAEAEASHPGALSTLDDLKVPFERVVLDTHLGSGSFGEVYKGFYEHSGEDYTNVAVKRLQKHRISTTSLKAMIGEIMIVHQLRHNNIVQLYGWTTEPYVCLVLELMGRGSLRTHLDIIRKKEMAHEGWTPFKSKLAIDTALGMLCIHTRGFIHRDLKADNLLLNDDFALKIGDFGSARSLSSSLESGENVTMTRTGSPLWMAPEIVKSAGRYTESADVWSFGVVLCELYSLRMPFETENGHSLFNYFQVLDGNLSPLAALTDFSATEGGAMRDLISRCCHPVPEQRPIMREVLFALFDIALREDTLPQLYQGNFLNRSPAAIPHTTSHADQFAGFFAETQRDTHNSLRRNSSHTEVQMDAPKRAVGALSVDVGPLTEIRPSKSCTNQSPPWDF